MTARIYVGTYAKYNRGSIKGAWLNLEDYSDKDAFLVACAELHKDEADHELMFQDFEGFPREFYSESCIKDELFEWLELDEDDRVLLELYTDNIDSSGDIEAARDAYLGKADTEAGWAEDWLRETGGLEGVPEHLENYIDYAAYARDAEVTFVRSGGELWVFHNG
ncbi:antirestriction protein ArdA [Nitrobacteraceae bacterium UC4449_H16]